jgi:RNA polymerase sigma factor (sigma-70 family)
LASAALKVPLYLRDDAEAEALAALVDAYQRFDPTKASWTTYALPRARGAILDFLRRWNPLSRGMRAKVKTGQIHDVVRVSADTKDRYGRSILDQIPAIEASEKDIIHAVDSVKRISLLPMRLRKVIKARLHGSSIAEIAKSEKIHVTRVSQLIGEALHWISELDKLSHHPRNIYAARWRLKILIGRGRRKCQICGQPVGISERQGPIWSCSDKCRRRRKLERDAANRREHAICTQCRYCGRPCETGNICYAHRKRLLRSTDMTADIRSRSQRGST